ncbi:uncharacterized protein BCR38DRAFT_341998 [Pseudomassariella vexata]|uniref:C2H2-type domain-containing protein n=1 Tax=Pseudomassariella vexata TaxID=1141098 RepID=A0A1Y2E0D3_9PEZI|nr:uncharacterized protein BCR38DRAFT_341998 [Pseudomassariella vexata]ORY64998.1 hypothetical protein BCR38DRAFT_341998 [Pseudomassariella vexata]
MKALQDSTSPASLSGCIGVSEDRAKSKSSIDGESFEGFPSGVASSTSVIAQPIKADRKQELLCICCSKTRRFDTEEKLNEHIAERPYHCTFCDLRFTSRNDARRHKDSIHVRKVSWSCSALSNDLVAFRETHPGRFQCGYCGLELELVYDGTDGSLQLTEQHISNLLQHLKDTHRHRLCPLNKNFFRLDHFQQHIKHSHAAKPGNWLYTVERACLVPPE